MKLKQTILFVCVVLIVCCATTIAKADELTDMKARLKALEQENRMLREKIGGMESTQVATMAKLQQELETAKLKKKRNGWMTAEYQFDTRGFNTINFTGGAKLPDGWSLWGFIDIESADSDEGSRTDAQEFFTEIDLKKELYKGFGVVLEYNDGETRHNSIGRLGANYIARWDWLKKMDLNLGFKAFPIETDGHGYQVSFCWEKKFPKFWDGKFSMGGFFDLNFDSGPSDNETNMVHETQFRYKLTENLEALVEYRFNGYKVASQEQGLGIGMKYKF
ncbi:MAG: hypothetical protein H8D47_03670 [Planctomycetes bacterium]|nr:hypothetical protein [Planctomycetota bacterium]MBL7107595.1 hypothetical protein [Phycisphaerae bacterium]